MIKTDAYYKNGKLELPYMEQLRDRLRDLEGLKLLVTIEKFPETASPNQHGYYRAVNRWLTYNTETFGGWGEDMIHSFAANMFLAEPIIFRVKTKSGAVKEYVQNEVPSTSKLSKSGMSAFMQKWFDYLSYEHGIEVPPPEYFHYSVVTLNDSSLNIDEQL